MNLGGCVVRRIATAAMSKAVPSSNAENRW